MLVISGFFNDEDRFVPDKPVKVPHNTKVKIAIDEEELLKKQTALIEESIKLLEESRDEILPDDFAERFKWHSAPREIAL